MTNKRLIKAPVYHGLPNLRMPTLYGKHVLFSPQLCARPNCSDSQPCERCREPQCAFCHLTGWKLGGPCSVETATAIIMWRCAGCMIVGLQPIMEPDNVHGMERALVKQHAQALGRRCRVNAVPEYIRVR